MLLCYNSLGSLATHHLDIKTSVKHLYDDASNKMFENMQNGDVVFVKSERLDDFRKRCLPSIKTLFVLLSGASDHTVGDEYVDIANHPLLLMWYGSNITISYHPRIQKLLIGFAECEYQGGDQEYLQSVVARPEKSRVPLLPWVAPTHGSRHNILTSIPIHRILSRVDFKDYMSCVNDHLFVLCARGNGIDTHRIVETLLCGSLPVVVTSGLDDLYRSLPIIIVDSYESMRQNDLDEFVPTDIQWQNFQKMINMSSLKAMIDDHKMLCVSGQQIIIHHHLGLGDHFICNGIVNSFTDRGFTVLLPAKVHNYVTVCHLYSANPLVHVFKVQHEDTDIIAKSIETNVPIVRIGFEKCNPLSFEQSFYNSAYLHYHHRYTNFRMPVLPSQTYPVPSEPYIIVHKQASETIKHNTLKIETELLVVEIQSTSEYPNLFSYLPLIRGAQEIHCVHSSIYCLVDSICGPHQKLFFHDARPNVASYFNVHVKWNIVTYD